MFIIQAPYPFIESVILLRSPDFQDSQSLPHEVSLSRSMNGTRYTVVKTVADNRLLFNWQFQLTRMKSLEFQRFHRLYINEKWQITDHKDRMIIGYCKTNPLESQVDSRSVYGTSNELVQVDFEFEGYIVGS